MTFFQFKLFMYSLTVFLSCPSYFFCAVYLMYLTSMATFMWFVLCENDRAWFSQNHVKYDVLQLSLLVFLPTALNVVPNTITNFQTSVETFFIDVIFHTWSWNVWNIQEFYFSIQFYSWNSGFYELHGHKLHDKVWHT